MAQTRDYSRGTAFHQRQSGGNLEAAWLGAAGGMSWGFGALPDGEGALGGGSGAGCQGWSVGVTWGVWTQVVALCKHVRTRQLSVHCRH